MFSMNAPDIRVLGLVGGRDPVVDVRHVGLPVEPDLARLFGEEVLLLETDGAGESRSAVTDQEDPGRSFENLERHLRRVAEPLDGRNCAGAHGRAVHAACSRAERLLRSSAARRIPR